jgi:protein-disulfide isomerase
MRLSLLAACILLPCFAADSKAQPAPHQPAATTPPIDKKQIEDYVRHLHVWGPQITVKVGDPKPSNIDGLYEVIVAASAGQASLQEPLLVSKDGQKIIRGVSYDLRQNPFQGELAKLTTAGDPSFGPADAPVTLVVFSDLQCSYCKVEAKSIRENIPKNYPKEVRVVFKDYPLDQIHPWARTASIAGRCIAKQNNDAFWKYHDWVFENQAQITVETVKTKIGEWAKAQNLETIGLSSCIETKATEPEVNAAFAQGRQLSVDSTPTSFLNGRKLVGTHQWAQLKQIIDHEIEYQKTRAACCEVKVPSLLTR